MNRRTLLKGAVIAASTPVAIAAPIAVAGLAETVKQFNEVKILAKQAENASRAILKQPGAAAFPAVGPEDFRDGKGIRFGKMQTMPTPQAIDRFFKGREESIQRSENMLGAEYAAEMIETNRKEWARARELYEARDTKWQLWQKQSGYDVAEEEANRLYNLLGELEDRIMFGPAQSLSDARLKLAHVKAEYGSEITSEAAIKVLESLAA